MATADPWALAIMATLAAWATVVMGWPASGDAQVFLWLADLAVHGGAPYKDAFETKGPMAWLPLVPGVAFAGFAAPWVIRAVDVVFCACGVVACWRLAKGVSGVPAARLASLSFAGWWCGRDFWVSAQPDAWAGVWIAWAVACADGRKRGPLVASGLLIGCAAMVKPFYLAFLVVPWLWRWQPGRRTRVGAAEALLLAGGAVIGVALPALALWLLGAWQGWLECLRWTALVYAPGDVALARLPILVAGALAPPVGVLLPWAVAGMASTWHSLVRAPAGASAIWILGALAAVFVQGKFWPYHWLPLSAPVAVWGAAAIARLARSTDAPDVPSMGRTAFALAACFALLAPAQQLYRRARAMASPAARAVYEAREFGSYGRQPGGLTALVDSLFRASPSHDRVLVWAFHPGLAPVLGRPAATRYAIIRPLFDGEGSVATEALRADFLLRLRSRLPRWWILPTMQNRERREESDAWRIDRFPAAAALLEQHYDLALSSRDWSIYELRKPTPSAGEP